MLKPGGIAVTTWFVYDDERLPRTVGPHSAYPMVHELDDVTRYNDPEDPLRAIAFREDAMRAWVEAAGLVVERVDRGSWCGEEGRIFQDLVVLRRPLTPADQVRAFPARARRLVRRLTSR